MIYYLFDYILFSMTTQMPRQDMDPAGSVISWPPEFGSVIQDYTSPRIRIRNKYLRIRNTDAF
jgi:hypothetical protein